MWQRWSMPSINVVRSDESEDGALSSSAEALERMFRVARGFPGRTVSVVFGGALQVHEDGLPERTSPQQRGERSGPVSRQKKRRLRLWAARLGYTLRIDGQCSESLANAFFERSR